MVFPVFESADFQFAVLELISKKKNMTNIVMFWKRMPPKGSGTIGCCVLIGVGVVLLEKVCHCIGRLWGLIYASALSSKIDQFLLLMS